MTVSLQRHSAAPAQTAEFDEDERLSLILSSSFVGSWDRNLLTGGVWVSPSFKTLLGYADHEIGTSIDELADLVHPEDRGRRLVELERHWRDHTPYDVEYRLRHHDGTYRWFRVCGESIWQPDGKPRRMAGALIDITERKQAEASANVTLSALQSSETQFRSLITHIPGACFRILANETWTPIFLSEGIQRITGRPVDNFLLRGLNYSQLLVHPDDVGGLVSATRQALADRRPFSFEYRVNHIDGRTRWAHEEGQGVFDAEGNLLHVDGVILDVTERKQAEAALRDSEAKFASLLANIPGACYRTKIDDAWTMLFLSDAAEAFLGHPAKDFLAGGPRRVVDFIHPDDRESVRQSVMESIRTKQPSQVEYRVVHADGTVRWVLDRGQCSFNEAGNPLFQDGVIFDITDRKHASEQRAAALRIVRENETKFRTLVENIPGACYRCRTDDDLTVLYASDRIEEITGYRPDELELNRLASFSSIIHRDDWPAAKRTIWDSIERHQSFAVEYRIVRPDGSIRWVSDRGQGVFAEDGTVLFQDGVLLDVTERKLSEARLKAAEEAQTAETADRYQKLQCIIDNMADGVALFDAEMRLAAFNRRMVEMGELAAPFAQLGTLYDDLIRNFVIEGDYGPGDVDAILAGKMAEVRSGNPALYEIARHDGRFIEVRRNPMPDGGAVFTYRDVTHHRVMETQLRESQKLEALGQLAGGVAHEFNNLLTAIGGFSRLAIKKQNDPDRVAMCLEEVVKASERAADLTKQLLAFGRKQVLETSVVSVPAIVRDLVGMLRPLLGETIELAISAPEDEKACVVADATQLSQAVLNLCINARDAMPNGGRLEIGVDVEKAGAPCRRRREHCAGEAYVVLTVSDTGTGIDPEILPRIFEPFFTTKEQGKGTGLGLAVVYGMVDQLGGTIDVESEAGKGTTFTICLAEATQPADERTEEESAASAERPTTVLIVDDEKAICDFTAMTLADLGYQVLTASSAVDAVAVFKKHEGAIDILLTDVVMPGQSGPDLARGLSEANPSLLVIFMSGYPNRGADNSEFYRLPEGAAFIYKPFTPDAIGTLVSSVAASQAHAAPPAIAT